MKTSKKTAVALALAALVSLPSPSTRINFGGVHRTTVKKKPLALKQQARGR